MKKYIAFSLFLVSASLNAQTNGSIPDVSEIQALRDLYEGTEGSEWVNNTGWPGTQSNWNAITSIDQVIGWHGVTVSNGDVTSINLYSNGLKGELSFSIGDLRALTYLNLGQNALIGSIPSQITDLTNLTDLRLNSNQLSGPIPARIGDLIQLEVLFFNSNGLYHGIPNSIGNLQKLKYLYLNNNSLSDKIPDSIGFLTNLLQLYLYDNLLLGEVPGAIGKLTNLRKLHLSQNRLSGILPINLTYLTNLDLLDLSENSFVSFPDFTSHPTPSQIDVLIDNNNIPQSYIDANIINDVPIFSSFIYIPQKNGQVGDDVEIQALRELYELTGGGNWSNQMGWPSDDLEWQAIHTTDQINGWFGVTTMNGDVTSINLYNNALAGTIPSSLADLSSLTYLNLGVNMLSGQIPPQITRLGNLKDLRLNGNRLSNVIPSLVGEMVSLETLYLHNNDLQGPIPPSIGGLTNLKYLYLGHNQLDQQIPPGITQLTNALQIFLNSNNFHGEWPQTPGSLPSLRKLHLSDNSFFGEIPNYFLSLGNLDYLDVSHNKFTSSPNFSNHPNKQNLDLSLQFNAFNFATLEPIFNPNGSHSFKTLNFSPQSPPDTVLLELTIPTDTILNDRVGGVFTEYHWQKWNGTNWEDITSATTENLTLADLTVDDNGAYYRCKMENSRVPGLTLYSSIFQTSVDYPLVVEDANICSGQSANLTATGPGIINWYNEPSGGISLFTGNEFTTPSLTQNKTYYVSQTVAGVESDRVEVMVFVGPIFTITENQTLCDGESIPITVQGEDLVTDWGIEIGNQNSFVAQPDTTTTYTYTVQDKFGCTDSGQVTITVIDPVNAEILPTIPVCPGQTATLEAVEVTGATYAWEPGGLTGRTVDVVINELQEYTLTVTSANGCTAQASILPEIQSIAVASEDREICVVDSVTLVAEGGDSYVWSTGDTIPEITFKRMNPGIYTLTVTATKDGCSASDDVVVTVNAFCPGTPISFMARAISTTEIELNWQEPPGNHTEYVIQRRNAAAVYETVATLPVGTTAWPDSGLQPGTVYFYRIYSQVGTAQSEMRFARARTFTPNQNYIMETEVLTEGITNVALVPNLNYHQRNSTWNYLNGLGSDMQTVVEGASPSEKDVVQPIIYDEYGMRSKQYLSYTIAQTTEPGNFRDDAEQETTDFYANPPTGIASTSFPYAETVFDTSPQNKVLEQGSTGEAWQVSTGNTIKIDRTTNAASDVLHWKISGIQLEAQGYYPAAQLKKTVTVNEDDETVLLYEDMLGRELMRKVERAAGDIIIYFVYNNRGSLLYRITPNVISGLTGLPPFTIDQNTLLTQCYSYQYDAQEKLIEEKWPDQEAIYYVYDQWDRLVLSQSGNQRQKKQWTFTKYDRFDRPVLTGLLDTTDFTRSAMQSAIDNYYATGGSRYEAYEGVNGAVHGYTNDTYPVLADENAYLSVTYYDSYDFIQSDTLFGAAYAYDSSMLGCQDSPQGEYCFPAAPLKILRGKVTGSKTKVLNQDQWLPGVVYYDDDGRTIQAIAQNHTGGIDRASTLHNFAGWPLMTYSTLNMPGTDNYAIRRKFIYDHAGRLKEGYHELFKNDVGQGEKFLAENVYNELGQLIEKNLHVEQDIPLQSVDYRYNIRGWLQSINTVQFSVDGRNNDVNDLFGMEILYQNPLNGVQPGGN